MLCWDWTAHCVAGVPPSRTSVTPLSNRHTAPKQSPPARTRTPPPTVPVGSHSVHEILDAAADEASNVYGGYAARCTYSATRQEASASNLLAGCEAELTRATQPRNVGSSLMIDRDWRSQKGECFDDSLRIMPSHAGSPVRLVDARYLVQLAERGEILRRRQDMPGHAFLGLDELREMSHLADALRVVVISKPW